MTALDYLRFQNVPNISHFHRNLGGLFIEYIQLRAKQTAPLVNKHYENEVTLRQQN